MFAEGQVSVVADAITARMNAEISSRTYDGNGICYVEFGHELVARVQVTFASGQPPFGHFDTASEAASAEKDESAASRLRRWIG